MKQFLSFVKKEFFHILRDKRTILILLVMPIVQIILFGFALSTEIRNIRVGVYDPSNDLLTQQVVRRFDANDYFTVGKMLTSAAQADEAFRRDEIDVALVFGVNFRENFLHSGVADLQVLADGTDPNTANIVTGYAANMVRMLNMELAAENPGQALPAWQIEPRVKLLFNPQMKSAYNFVPGVMGLILMLICAMMTSISIVREKERGTMEVLLVSPMKPLWIIIAKAVPYLLLSAVNLLTILLLSVFVLEVPVAGSLFWLTVISLIYIFTALALGLLISSVVDTQIAAMLASSLVLMMPVMVLSGMIFPVENMPAVLRWLSAIIPARWYIDAVKKIMIEGSGFVFFYKELLILSGMAVFLLALSFGKFKNRLE